MFTRLNHISATDFVFVFLRKNSNTRDFTNGLIPESAGKDPRLKLTFHRSKVNLAGTSCKKHRQTWSMISKEKFKGFILSFILLLVLALNVFSCVSCDFAVLFYLLVFPYDALLLTSQGQRFKTTRLVVFECLRPRQVFHASFGWLCQSNCKLQLISAEPRLFLAFRRAWLRPWSKLVNGH